MENQVEQRLLSAAHWIRSRSKQQARIGLILGSGLGILADEIEQADRFPYADIPHFPLSTVEGHAGKWVMGQLEGQAVIAMQGRVHYYEGYAPEEIIFPTRLMKLLGVEHLIVTNACGSLREDFPVGSMVFIKDQINFMGSSFLRGPNFDKLGPRFPDMSQAYDPAFRQMATRIAQELSVNWREGIHLAVSGPCFETKAEMKAFRLLGADTVGMSTIPEAIAAAHAGMKTLGIACVTDLSVPDKHQGVSHEEVMAIAERMKPDFIRLIKGILRAL